MSFIEKIRKSEIPQPTQPKFDLAVWEEKWSQEPQKDKNNESVYQAGKIIFSLLEEIRSELRKLHKKKPEASNEKLIMAYFAISNRDRAILSNNPEDTITGKVNVFSSLLNNNRFFNELTLEEISNGCVDGIEKAVQLRINKEKSLDEKTYSNSSLAIIDFISQEIFLSQMYDAYESYWQALLWGEYTFYEIDGKQKIFGVSQNMTPYEISGVASQIRKSRLNAQSQLIIAHQNLKDFFLQEKIIFKRSNSDDDLSVRAIISADDKVQTMNSEWHLQEANLEDEFPMEAINNDQGISFSISDALNVLRLLMLLSMQITQNYPADDKKITYRELH